MPVEKQKVGIFYASETELFSSGRNILYLARTKAFGGLNGIIPYFLLFPTFPFPPRRRKKGLICQPENRTKLKGERWQLWQYFIVMFPME